MPIKMITGGARSGKSTYAEKICKEASPNVTYIACSTITDDDMARRVEIHRRSRPQTWHTVEQYKDFSDIKRMGSDVYLLDCMTTMVTNLMFDDPIDYDTCTTDEIEAVEADIMREVDALLAVFEQGNEQLVIVSNEVGQGIVPAYRLGSIFRDIAGRVNQHIASRADEVICMISGLPLKLK